MFKKSKHIYLTLLRRASEAKNHSCEFGFSLAWKAISACRSFVCIYVCKNSQNVGFWKALRHIIPTFLSYLSLYHLLPQQHILNHTSSLLFTFLSRHVRDIASIHGKILKLKKIGLYISKLKLINLLLCILRFVCRFIWYRYLKASKKT